MTIQDIRRANLRAWVQKNGTPSKEKSYFSQVLSSVAPLGERAARRLERDYRMGAGYLDGAEVAQQADDAAGKTVPSESPLPANEPWPFPSIPEKDVRALPPAQLSKLEGALALAIAQMKLDISVVPTSVRRPYAGSGVANMDDLEDPFPMRLKEPAPWEAGGVTTKQMDRDGLVRFSTDKSIVANVAPGEPYAANDKFEKVPELADVRLAAGDGIENPSEAQTGVMQFRSSFLRSVGADRGGARVVYAKGDSMEPVIRDGAALLVVPDEGLTLHSLVPDGVYAINYDGKMIVKVVAKDPLTGHWVARSFNSRYPDVSLEAEASVRVLGRVVWAGSRLDR